MKMKSGYVHYVMLHGVSTVMASRVFIVFYECTTIGFVDMFTFKVNEDIIQILNDPGVQLGIPQKLKSHAATMNAPPIAAARKVKYPPHRPMSSIAAPSDREQHVGPQNPMPVVPVAPCPAELNMQNLAIHQTLMNEASAMTAKQQIMRNYMILTDKEETSREI